MYFFLADPTIQKVRVETVCPEFLVITELHLIAAAGSYRQIDKRAFHMVASKRKGRIGCQRLSIRFRILLQHFVRRSVDLGDTPCLHIISNDRRF